jgi:hypothetical protein
MLIDPTKETSNFLFGLGKKFSDSGLLGHAEAC